MLRSSCRQKLIPKGSKTIAGGKRSATTGSGTGSVDPEGIVEISARLLMAGFRDPFGINLLWGELSGGVAPLTTGYYLQTASR